MGFFSWLTSDSKESISNKFSVKGALPVVMILPDNQKITEKNYEGYGVFGGRDYFEMVTKYNVPEKYSGDHMRNRGIGINLVYDKTVNERLKLPKFVSLSEAGSSTWQQLSNSADCPHQGYFYEDNINEDENY